MNRRRYNMRFSEAEVGRCLHAYAYQKPTIGVRRPACSLLNHLLQTCHVGSKRLSGHTWFSTSSTSSCLLLPRWKGISFSRKSVNPSSCVHIMSPLQRMLLAQQVHTFAICMYRNLLQYVHVQSTMRSYISELRCLSTSAHLTWTGLLRAPPVVATG